MKLSLTVIVQNILMLLQECLIFGNFVLETTEKVQFPGVIGHFRPVKAYNNHIFSNL